jgi:hypothetical protein
MKLLIAGFFLAAVYTSASAVADAPQKPPKTAEPARKPAKVAPAPAASGEAIPQLRTAVQLSAITGGKLIPTVVPGSTSPPVAIAPPTQVPPWPFYITILVIVTAGVVNYWLNTRTMRNQTSEATQGRQADHQNKISEYRHAWLQELRDTASELVKAIYQAQSALMRTNLSRDYRDSLSNRDHADVVAKHQAAVLAAAAEERVAMAEMRKHAAKIKLLFKPNDPQAAPFFCS